MDKAPDNKALAGRHDIPFPFESEFGRRLTIADICHYAPGMLNKIGKEGKTSWDSFGYALMMGHNVYCHIVAVQRANNLMDIELKKIRPNWKDWNKLSGKDSNSGEVSDWVPRNILYFDRFVGELFECETKDQAFAMIDSANSFLENLEGARLRGGIKNEFNRLFGDGEDWVDDREDIKLEKMEHNIKEEE